MNKMYKVESGFEIPILLVVFNRVKPLKELVSSLRLVKPKKIYISSDGAREDKPNESHEVQAVRDFLCENIDWDCEVYKNYSVSNQGCKLAVSRAVKWFFSLEEKGIILEDDCIPSLHFYEYCETLLSIYKKDYSVGSISGRNELGAYGNKPIIFSSKFICWGWASWADRVLELDVEYGYNKSDEILFESGSLAEKLHIKTQRAVMLNKQVNSWAFSFDFGFRRKKQVCIIPQYNMISNVGFGIDGTHSSSRDSDGVDNFTYPKISGFSKKLQVVTDRDYVKKLILTLYSWPKLLMLSNMGLLYPLRPLYRNIRKAIKKN